MNLKSINFTRNALDVIEEREIDNRWVLQAITNPHWVEKDPQDDEVERHFRVIDEYDGRVLRVACVENMDEIRVISAFFDRRARKPL